MRIIAAIFLVFWGGFAVMALEIVGAQFLVKDFGSSFYVWTSQIGVILTALAGGYYAGGAWADRYHRPRVLAMLLVPTGLFILWIPDFGPTVISWIVDRHPLDEPIPAVWQKLDPAMGSALVFLLPCFVLASLSPFMIRLTSQHLDEVGTISGVIFCASTIGSIAGVFLSGYVFLDLYHKSTIIRGAGLLTLVLAGICLWMDHAFQPSRPKS